MASSNKTDKLQLPQWQLSDKPEMSDFNDAFEKVEDFKDEFDSHKAESAYWIRVDNLSAPLYIGDSSYQNKAIVPMNVSNSENKIFAIRFANAATLATNQKQIVIMEGNMSPTGRVIDIWIGGTLRDIRPSSAGSMAFYLNQTEDVYIHAIYLVKDMEV